MAALITRSFEKRLIALAALVYCVSCISGAWAEPPVGVLEQLPGEFDNAERLLLLTNGQVLRGRVTLDAKRYYVATPTADIQVPIETVEHVCRSLEEGYRLKRASLTRAGSRERVRLIQWCLVQGLLDQADAEIIDAEREEPNNTHVELLRRRLKLARQPPMPAPPPKPLAEPPVSDTQLDALVRVLPAAAVEEFSKTVQPLLLNSCAAAGCHGPTPRSEFQLIRLARGQTPSRRITQRNLHAAMSCIDRQHPEKSPLLTAAAKAHGNTEFQKFSGTGGAPLQHLTRWVQQVTRPDQPAKPETVVATEATLSQSIGDSAQSNRPTQARQRNVNARGVAGPLVASRREGAQELASPSKAPLAPATDPMDSTQNRQRSPASLTPISNEADPFDPELFNQRFHGDKPKDE